MISITRSRLVLLVCCFALALLLPNAGQNASALERILADAASFANVDDFVTRHFVVDLTADFKQRTLAGTVELQLIRRNASARELVLDTRDLTISKVESAA